MRGLSFVLAAIVGFAAAVDQCTPSNSGTCCQGYTYNVTPLQKRATLPVCDGKSIDPAPGLIPPTCDKDSSGTPKNPVCTAIKTLPQGSMDATLYCGNPLANTGSGTVTGTLHVEIVPCPAPSTENCFKLTAIAPTGTTLDNDFKVQISPKQLTSDNPGKFATKVTSQPVYVPFSLVYGTGVDPCKTSATTVWIGFHASEGGQTCWAGGSPPLSSTSTTIPGGNQNWALQFSFSFTCKDFCTSWCCCPLPPTIPDCPPDFSQSCQNQCNPIKTDAQCKLLNINNPPGWTTNPYYAQKCCCKPPDTPQCPSGKDQYPLDSSRTCSTSPGVCSALFGSIADCKTGLVNGVCCCCTPKTECPAGTGTLTPNGCSGTPQTGQTCTLQDDGCGGNICCCTTCSPTCPAGTGTLTPNGCSGTSQTGQTCTLQNDGCGGQACCCQAIGTCSTETAFGVPADCQAGAVCSTNTLKSKNCGRWGWYINADLSGGATPTYRLHAGAGQNDLSHGKDVGSVVIQPCSSGSSQYCAFFTTTSGWVIVDAHVEADCDALSSTAPNFPCAPGGYNDNGGGTCGSGGLPSSTWTSQPFMACGDKNYYVIFHAAVSNDPDCSSSNCGDADTDLGTS